MALPFLVAVTTTAQSTLLDDSAKRNGNSIPIVATRIFYAASQALFRCKIRCKRRHFSTRFDKSAQAENYRQANPLTHLSGFSQVLTDKGASVFDSRWG
jgi:hypothetical protein